MALALVRTVVLCCADVSSVRRQSSNDDDLFEENASRNLTRQPHLFKLAISKHPGRPVSLSRRTSCKASPARDRTHSASPEPCLLTPSVKPHHVRDLCSSCLTRRAERCAKHWTSLTLQPIFTLAGRTRFKLLQRLTLHPAQLRREGLSRFGSHGNN